MSEQYEVYGQDKVFNKKTKRMNKVKICRHAHQMEETFLPSRGQYKKCKVCGYYETIHGGDYF